LVFAAFILLSGTTHWLDLITLWTPLYGLLGLVKALTAIVSVVTAVSLWFLFPAMVALPSPLQMRQANEALLASRAQLAQAQKMEAVGQLTGGIAHDFNNMLAIVIGSLNLLKRRLARGEGHLERFIDAATDGAHRAAKLTQRLLAFSRQQPLAPQALDVNKFVAGLSELLRRTLGASRLPRQS
jgi:signal transduction histidine kinase